MASRKIIYIFLLAFTFFQQSFAQDEEPSENSQKIKQAMCVLHRLQNMIIDGVDVFHQTGNLDEADKTMLATLQNFKNENASTDKSLWWGGGSFVFTVGSVYAWLKATKFQQTIHGHYLENLLTLLQPTLHLLTPKTRASVFAIALSEDRLNLFEYNAKAPPREFHRGFDEMIQIVKEAGKDDASFREMLSRYVDIYKKSQRIYANNRLTAGKSELFREAISSGRAIDYWITNQPTQYIKDVISRLYGDRVLQGAEATIQKAVERTQPELSHARLSVKGSIVGMVVGAAGIAVVMIYKAFFDNDIPQSLVQTDVTKMDPIELTDYLEDHMDDVNNILKLDPTPCN